MTTSASSSPTSRLTDAAARVAVRLGDAELTAGVGRLDDEALLELLTEATDGRKALELIAAAASAEVARRSARDLGYGGLAQRRGHRTGTSLVQNITGQSRGDVTRAVQAGAELAAPTPVDDTGGSTDAAVTPVATAPEWLRALREALRTAGVTQAQFHAIRTGLGEPPVERYPELDDDFLPAAWTQAVRMLLEEAEECAVEELRAQARIARDRLDPVGVTLRFEERFAARSFRMWIDESGQRHGRFAFDDDAAAWVDAILQAALRPRRGPRFVGADAEVKTQSAESDERTNEQLQYDTLVAVLRTGAVADPAQAFGDRQPGVRIIVEASAISGAADRGEMRVGGVGHLEDGGAAVPGGVVETYLCDAGAIPVLWDAEHGPLDVGRELRFFTRKQRLAIAARDGGCMWPSCSAPISQCEYHRVDHWWEHHGRTDVDDGIALCRNCHLRLHNQRWRISRERDAATGANRYFLHGPPDPSSGEIAPPVELRSKSPRRFTAA